MLLSIYGGVNVLVVAVSAVSVLWPLLLLGCLLFDIRTLSKTLSGTLSEMLFRHLERCVWVVLVLDLWSS